ncbi:hypothetical protein B0H14DRAFT_2591914 [Mycena olivaceomarginata]|nr:hypothetical protein B0H14DRAFT_2591914 [Mycena olivaceomarginata]
MSDSTKKGWGGSRVGSGRKKKAVVALSAPTCTYTRHKDVSAHFRKFPYQIFSSDHLSQPCCEWCHRVFRKWFFLLPTFHNNHESLATQLISPLDDPLDTSEHIFDKSLGDEDGEGDDSENAELVQKETEEAEPKSLFENHQWLKTTLAQIIKDTNGWLKMPCCYKDGQFWVCPRDSVFALNVSLSTASLQQVSISQYLSSYRTSTGVPGFIQV